SAPKEINRLEFQPSAFILQPLRGAMSKAAFNNEDIHAYLDRHQRKELLRFLTCGSVDDGKSTLIGRLLHDTKGIYEDQLAAVRRDSAKVGTTGGALDLALLTDGLKAERE